MKQVHALKLDARAFGESKICAIGPATAARLESFGLIPDVIPPRFVAESVVPAMSEHSFLKGAHVLLPRADIARKTLVEELQKKGAEVFEVVAYKTVKEDLPSEAVDELLGTEPIDAVTFTSSSTAKNFNALVGEKRAQALSKKSVFASIGPITSSTLEKLELPVHLEANQYDIPGLIDVLVGHFTAKE
jgi:uroporphyrinogen III methyltransferase/synthase